jgi:hypothetical protein
LDTGGKLGEEDGGAINGAPTFGLIGPGFEDIGGMFIGGGAEVDIPIGVELLGCCWGGNGAVVEGTNGPEGPLE